MILNPPVLATPFFLPSPSLAWCHYHIPCFTCNLPSLLYPGCHCYCARTVCAVVCRVYNCLLFVLCCLLSVPCCLLFTAPYRCLTSSGHLPLYFVRRKYSGRFDRSERGERKRAIRITHITPSFGTASTSSVQHPLCPAPAILVPASIVLRFRAS